MKKSTLFLPLLLAAIFPGCDEPTPPPPPVPSADEPLAPVAAPLQPVLSRHGRSYGWHRSAKPSGHPRYSIPPKILSTPLPASVDLRPGCPPVYDQGSLRSCTANALAGLHQFLQIKERRPNPFAPSRLMIYWGELAAEGNIGVDAGANGDDGVTFLQRYGVCPESTWPYDPAKFAVKPPRVAWNQAAGHKLSGQVTLGNAQVELKTWLATQGVPIAFGFSAYPELESDAVATSGVLPMPGPDDQPIGGHEVLIVGYDDTSSAFLCRNSWGSDWGLAGYFTMPYAYVTNSALAGDFRSASHVN